MGKNKQNNTPVCVFTCYEIIRQTGWNCMGGGGCSGEVLTLVCVFRYYEVTREAGWNCKAGGVGVGVGEGVGEFWESSCKTLVCVVHVL